MTVLPCCAHPGINQVPLLGQLASCQPTACSTQTYEGPKPQRPIFQTISCVRCKGVYGPRDTAGSFSESRPDVGSLQGKQEGADVTEGVLPSQPRAAEATERNLCYRESGWVWEDSYTHDAPRAKGPYCPCLVSSLRYRDTAG